MRLLLQIILYLPLLYGYWYVHARLSVWVLWLPDAFSTRPWQLAGLLAGSALSGVLAGAIVSAPVVLLYRQRAALIALTISTLGAALDFYLMSAQSVLSTRPFSIAAHTTNLIAFVLALPACALLLRQLRTRGSLKPSAPSGAPPDGASDAKLGPR